MILKNQLKTNTTQKIVFANYKTCKFIVKSVKRTQVTRFQKRLVPISKNIIKDKSKCPISLTERTFIHEIEYKCNQKSKLEVYPQFFTDQCYKRKWRLIM